MGYCDYQQNTIVAVDARRVPCRGGAHSAEPDPETGIAMSDIADELDELYGGSLQVVGWYHSHPFDEVKDSPHQHHCRFSAIDVDTQQRMQRQFDYMAGGPFVGIVVDPLTSLARRKFHIGAYRTYTPNGVADPEVSSPAQTPDGCV